MSVMSYNLVGLYKGLAETSELPYVVLQERLSTFLRTLALFIVVVAASLIASIILLTNTAILRPLRKITSAMESVAGGDLNRRVKIGSRDELEFLAEKFNEMTKELEKSRAQLKDYSKHLEDKVRSRTRSLRQKKEMLEVANKHLKELDRMKDEFINVISHELRNPLFPVLGYVELLRDGTLGKLNKKQAEKLDIIYKNAKQLQRLVQDVLDLTTLETKKMKFKFVKLNVSRIAKDAVNEFQPVANRKGIKLKAHLKKNLPKAVADEVRIREVLYNLITNAIKFTSRGCSIIVSTKKGKDCVRVSVMDSGIGIHPDHIPRIFDKFYQVDKSRSRQYEGTGLGLAICKEIVKAHNGKVSVTSEVGKGSTFMFELPLKLKAH
jgi:signal transduction histidine kinase